MSAPLSTYRVQFSAEFTFDDAQQLVPYLSRLGVTHLYSSPVLRARSGSTHGYDVVDPRSVNPELGGHSAFLSLISTLRSYGIGLIVDIVPNHMAACSENPYWMDVLTYGPGSPYSRWFDIDWRLPDPEFWGRVVIPILGSPIGPVVEEGELRLSWCDGRFCLNYYEHRFPIDPSTVHLILEPVLDAPELGELRSEIEEIFSFLHSLPQIASRVRRHVVLPRQQVEDRLARLAQIVESSPRRRAWVEDAASRYCEGEGASYRMKALLDRQPYRLAYWRQGARILNYRRFFDINDLIAVRQEDPEVFSETHQLVAQWLADGLIDGVRVDHIDGLRNPLEYLRSLRQLGGERMLLFIEKILASGEPLPEPWPVDGTTGYEFLNRAEQLFVCPEGLRKIEHGYRQLVRHSESLAELEIWGKRRALRLDLSALVGRLGAILMRIARQLPEYSDLDQVRLNTAVREFAVALPVYRTYLDGESREAWDEQVIRKAASQAGASRRVDARALQLLLMVLLNSELEGVHSGEAANFVARFQQLTGPAAAKGIEDTALYLYVPLVSLNEVGGTVEMVATDSASLFHQENQDRQERLPRALLAATTHDTKRSSDVRSRLDVLSQIPDRWLEMVRSWHRRNRRLLTKVGGRLAPDPVAEYLFYQILVALWPADAATEIEQSGTLVERVEEYMIKAVRESKRRTSWVHPNGAYEDALIRFVRAALDREKSAAFLKGVTGLVSEMAPGGFWNALSKIVLQFTSPGGPDIYQGDELWNFVLVDPDNRRPVDYELRRRLLDEVIERSEQSEAEFVDELIRTPEDPRIKVFTVWKLLHLRRRYAAVFDSGSYTGLSIEGRLAGAVLAFTRSDDEETVLVIASRFAAGPCDSPPPASLKSKWGDTRIPLRAPSGVARWRSWMTGREVRADRGESGLHLSVADALGRLPADVLVAVR